ncbi:ATP-binding protein [Paenibacillus nanensis]|uniref:ATP-binding protein n=1 Tax=Paenibacillus nanensis TaxID=393251 RepID=A0A3A1UNC1_9BACL|nr:ATP-binding protein [Paenibacillus nanensis]RIX47265.1 ATP-binding protein [Paenibacillus nanensis]
MRLRDKLLSSERGQFVGRSAELEMIRAHSAGDSRRQWLHFYGPGGIGKSTLLRQADTGAVKLHRYELDGGSGVRQKEEMLAQLSEQLRHAGESVHESDGWPEMVEIINRRAARDGCGIFLLIDTFENLRSVEDWLIGLLEQLEADIRIVSAGRHPLSGGWLRSGWTSFAREVPLAALPPSEVERYASRRGITESASLSRLVQFSGGIPLAMALAAEVMLRTGDPGQFDRTEHGRLIEVLMVELLRDLPPSVQSLIEAASVYWRFNEERLIAALNTEILTDAFRDLVQLPFVIRSENEWMLHDTVRAWALEDLIQRKPNTYEQMRRRALAQLLEEERLRPHLQKKLYIDKMNLHEHPFVRSTFFSGHLNLVELRECQQSDLPTIERLYLHYLRHSLPTGAAENHMAWLLRPVWEEAPSSFVTFWQDDEMIAFYAMVPLQERILELFRQEPLLKPFVQNWKPVPNAYFLSFMGMVPEIEIKTRSYFLNMIIHHFGAADWLLDFTCLQEWFPVFEYCGFERAEWAEARTPLGTEYRAFALDLTQEDFLAKLDRLLTQAPNALDPEPPAPAASPDLPALKGLLRQWHSLPHSPAAAEQFARLFPHRKPAAGQEAGQLARQELSSAMERMQKGNRREMLWGKMLKYAYTGESLPHERVAERLNLSMATYYRYLNKALTRLYQLLSERQ